MISKTVPTTKLCRNCGEYHDEMTQGVDTFRCDCGVVEDRDIHAAKNMIWLYENKVGVGRTNFKRVEIKALVSETLASGIKLESEKHEADMALACQ